MEFLSPFCVYWLAVVVFLLFFFNVGTSSLFLTVGLHVLLLLFLNFLPLFNRCSLIFFFKLPSFFSMIGISALTMFV